MKLKEAFEGVEYAFSKLLVMSYFDRMGSDGQFEIMPFDFLRYAKMDFREGSDRGYLNALTNAKRAIDCQIDAIFKSIGIDDIPKNSSFNSFVSAHERTFGKLEGNFKLRIISALELSPTTLVAEIRELRNKLEHYYVVPKSEDVKRALELAELFVKSMYSLDRPASDGLAIGSRKGLLREELTPEEEAKRINYHGPDDFDDPEDYDIGEVFLHGIALTYFKDEREFKGLYSKGWKYQKIEPVGINHPAYPYLVALHLSHDRGGDSHSIFERLFNELGIESNKELCIENR